MGNSYTNYLVRSDAVGPVVAVARRVCCGPAYVAPAGTGWVGVFDEVSEHQGGAMMHQLARDLSVGLDAAVFAFSVYESDVLKYLVYEAGRLVAEFDSWPDYDRPGAEPVVGADDRPEARRPHPDQLVLFDVGEPREPPTPGNPEAILRYCVPGTTLRQVRELLRQDSWATLEAERQRGTGPLKGFHRHQELARLLGIDDRLSHLGLGYLEEQLIDEGRARLPGVKKVRGRGKRRLPRPDRPPRSLAEAVEFADLGAIRRFLDAGADPNAAGRRGETVLSAAAADRQLDIGLALLAAGARLSGTEGRDAAMLLFLAAVQQGRPDAVSAIAASGMASSAALDGALLLAVTRTSTARPTRPEVEALEALIRAGADVNPPVPDTDTINTMVREARGPTGADVNARHWPGETPLCAAVASGHRAFIDVLIRRGADVNQHDVTGDPALIHAVSGEVLGRARRVVRRLLEAGADPEARDLHGRTALMRAVMQATPYGSRCRRAARVIGELIRARADVNARAPTGETALAMTRGWPCDGFDEIVATLRAAGAR